MVDFFYLKEPKLAIFKENRNFVKRNLNFSFSANHKLFDSIKIKKVVKISQKMLQNDNSTNSRGLRLLACENSHPFVFPKMRLRLSNVKLVKLIEIYD